MESSGIDSFKQTSIFTFLRRHAPFLLLAIVFVIDLAYLTRTYYWDGVLFSLNIEGVHRREFPFTVLIHPNHLLYSVLGYTLYATAVTLGFSGRAITVLQVFNVVLGIAATYLVYSIAKQLTSSLSIALFSGVLFAFGATWWKFSTDANTYILCVLLLLLVYRFVFQNPIRLAAAAGFHVLAMLFHEMSVFMYVPVIAAIASSSTLSRVRRFWISIAYLAGTGSAIALAYLLCYAQVDHGAYPNLFVWVTSYASDSGFTHSIGQLAGSYFASYSKLFLGGKLIFLRDYFSVTMMASLLVCVMALVWAFVVPASAADKEIQTSGDGVPLLWLWLVTYAIFLSAWDPGSAFHKLFVWPAVVLLLGAYVARHRWLWMRRAAFLGLAVAMGAWNFAAFIYPHSHDSADPVLMLARQINRDLPENAVIYYRAFDPDDWYLDYFAPGRQWRPLPADVTTLMSGIAPACFETTALPALPKSFVFAQKWGLVNKQHNIRLECLGER